jgi:hypothetical protein
MYTKPDLPKGISHCAIKEVGSTCFELHNKKTILRSKVTHLTGRLRLHPPNPAAGKSKDTGRFRPTVAVSLKLQNDSLQIPPTSQGKNVPQREGPFHKLKLNPRDTHSHLSRPPLHQRPSVCLVFQSSLAGSTSPPQPCPSTVQIRRKEKQTCHMFKPCRHTCQLLCGCLRPCAGSMLGPGSTGPLACNIHLWPLQ